MGKGGCNGCDTLRPICFFSCSEGVEREGNGGYITGVSEVARVRTEVRNSSLSGILAVGEKNFGGMIEDRVSLSLFPPPRSRHRATLHVVSTYKKLLSDQNHPFEV